jgi:hypothetical protein
MEWGVDYPADLVRWAEGRDFEVVLDLLAGGRVKIADLVTRRHPIADAASVYELVGSDSLGIVFEYPNAPEPDRPLALSPARRPGWASASSPAPSLAQYWVRALKVGTFDRVFSGASESGLSTWQMAEREGSEKAVAEADAVSKGPDAVCVEARGSHEAGPRPCRGRAAGKRVPTLRWTQPPVLRADPIVKQHFAGTTLPLVIAYGLNTGTTPPKDWCCDRRKGARLLGHVGDSTNCYPAIAGHDASSTMYPGSRVGEQDLLDYDVMAALGLPDGSLVSVSSGRGGNPKLANEIGGERGQGHSAALIGLSDLRPDTQSVENCTPDKGPVRQMRPLGDAIRGEAPRDRTSPGRVSSSGNA